MKNQIRFILIIPIVLLIIACSTPVLDAYQLRQTTPIVENSNPNIAQTVPVQTQTIPIQTQNASHFSMAEITQLVDLHNEVRANVGVGPVSWSNEVASTAQSWANQLGQRDCIMQHSQSHYGENLFMGWGGNYGVVDAVRAWESEKQYYWGQTIDHSNYRTFGHYTQMVWRNTQYIGCGKATCGQKIVIVCNYDPAGNYIGQTPY